MMQHKGNFKSVRVWVLVMALSQFSQLYALVLHPGREPNEAWVDRPDPAVLGRWASNASCVAVDANYILTTQHHL